MHLRQVHPLEGTNRIRLIRFLYLSNRNPFNPINPLLFLFQQRIRLIRCYFYFSKDADINPLFRLIRSKKSEQKSWKQCLYKPGSVSRAALLCREPSVIYLLRKSPCVSSILPSTVAMVGRDALKRWYT